MESGVRKPEPKTPSPSRVTSRSSCRERRRPACKRAILSRTELEPISTAANVGMGKADSLHARVHFVTAGFDYAADSMRSISVGLFALTLRDGAVATRTAFPGWMADEADTAATAVRILPAVTLWSSATRDD